MPTDQVDNVSDWIRHVMPDHELTDWQEQYLRHWLGGGNWYVPDPAVARRLRISRMHMAYGRTRRARRRRGAA